MERYYKKYSKFLVFPAVFLFICVVAIPFAIGLLYSFTYLLLYGTFGDHH